MAHRGVLSATPVSLSEAYRSATEKSETVLKGREQIAQVDARINQVKGGMFPNISANFTHSIQPLLSDPTARAFSPQQQTTISLSATQPIFRGLREWNGLSQLGHLHSAQEATQQDNFNRLFRDVASTYLQVLSLEQELKNLSEQSALYRERVKELSGRVERGESNQSDVVTAEATESSLLAEIRLTEGQLEVAREQFNFYTGLDRSAQLVDPNLAEELKLEPVEHYIEKIEGRPDIAVARENYEATSKAVTVAWGGHWPSVDVYGNYYLRRPGFLSDLRWDVGVQVKLPIFEGGTTQAKISEAVSRNKENYLELERVRRDAGREIRQLHRRLAARLDQLKNLKRSAELSRKNTTLLAKDYRRGLARNIDVQLALTEFRIVQRTFDQAHFATQLDLLLLQSATGVIPVQKKE